MFQKSTRSGWAKPSLSLLQILTSPSSDSIHSTPKLLPNQSTFMPAEPPPLEIHLRVNPKRTNTNMVHPVAVEAGSPVQYQREEVKHYRKWFPWLIPLFVVANIVMFVITMYVNNCPHNSVSCIATFLGRFSFQPFKENPLLGPSSLTWVSFCIFLLIHRNWTKLNFFATIHTRFNLLNYYLVCYCWHELGLLVVLWDYFALVIRVLVGIF